MSLCTMTIKRRYFDAILNGSKTVEYREVKPHWTARLERRTVSMLQLVAGYRPDSPRALVEVLGIRKEIRKGSPVYAIQLGSSIGL